MKPANLDKACEVDSAQKLKVLKMDMVLTAVDLNKAELAELLETDRPSVSKALTQAAKYKRLQMRIAEAVSARVRVLFGGDQPAA